MATPVHQILGVLSEEVGATATSRLAQDQAMAGMMEESRK